MVPVGSPGIVQSMTPPIPHLLHDNSNISMVASPHELASITSTLRRCRITRRCGGPIRLCHKTLSSNLSRGELALAWGRYYIMYKYIDQIKCRPRLALLCLPGLSLSC